MIAVRRLRKDLRYPLCMAIDTAYNQHIPRPGGSYLKTTPKWAAKAVSLREVLDGKLLAGTMDKMLPAPGAETAEEKDCLYEDNTYAVAVPLISDGGEVFVVLTKRSADMEADPGHISFPGGKLEPGESFFKAALREAQEEINLRETDIEKTAFLGIFERPLSEAQRKPSDAAAVPENFEGRGISGRDDSSGLRIKQKIASFAVLLGNVPDFKANRSEVEKIFLLPLSDLLEEGAAWDEIWSWERQSKAEINFFSEPKVMGRDLIWGLTARILTALITLLADSV